MKNEKGGNYMATTYQAQLQHILEDGTVIYINPINDAMDTTVGQLSNGDVTKLPGESKNEMLQETLRNIRSHLYNIKDISKKLRRLSASVNDSTDATIPASSVTYLLHSRLSAAETAISSIDASLGGKAPTNHASNALTYGGGTGEKYGHVKLSDLYASQANTTGAASSVGASQLAVYNAYNTLNTNKAPNDHSSTAKTYGVGTSAKYGHVMTYDIANTTTDPTTSTDTAQVATRRALYNIWKRLADKDSSQDTSIAGKAAISHASTANSYGVGTTGSYGHLKISNTYSESSPTDAASGVSAGMAASSYALRAAYNSLTSSLSGKAPTSHASTGTGYGLGTASYYGHVKLSDTYTSGLTASNGVAASTKALYDVYSLVSGLQTTVNTLNSNMDELSVIKNSGWFKTKSWTTIGFFSCYASLMQKSTYAIIPDRLSTNYRPVICNLSSSFTSVGSKITAGAFFMMQYAIAIRQFTPVQLNTIVDVIIDEPGFEPNNEQLWMVERILSGDIGKTISIKGGVAVVNIGTYIMATKKTLTYDELVGIDTTKVNVRTICPKFHVDKLPDGVQGIYISVVYTECMPISFRDYPTYKRSQTSYNPSNLTLFNMGYGMHSQNGNTLSIDCIGLPLPDSDAYPLIAIVCNITYTPATYRGTATGIANVTEANIGVCTNDNSIDSPYELYDLDRIEIPYLYTEQSPTSKTVAFTAFFMVKQNLDDTNVGYAPQDSYYYRNTISNWNNGAAVISVRFDVYTCGTYPNTIPSNTPRKYFL